MEEDHKIFIKSLQRSVQGGGGPDFWTVEWLCFRDSLMSFLREFDRSILEISRYHYSIFSQHNVVGMYCEFI